MLAAEREQLRKIRQHLIRLLFLREFHEADEISEQNQLYFNVILPSEGAECDFKEKVLEKYDRIVEALPKIDSVLTARMQSWNLRRIGLTEKSILRLGAYEMMYEKIPGKIVINEAVELAKIYGGDHSYSFINGVLARIIKGLDDNGEQSSDN